MTARKPADEFAVLLGALVQRYGSRDALGKAIGMSGSRVGRAIDGQYAFNIANCLKLAEATGESASAILRAAGKAEVAGLIERLFGQSRPSLGATDRELLDRWSKLPIEDKERFKGLIWRLSESPARPAKRSA